MLKKNNKKNIKYGNGILKETKPTENGWYWMTKVKKNGNNIKKQKMLVERQTERGKHSIKLNTKTTPDAQTYKPGREIYKKANKNEWKNKPPPIAAWHPDRISLIIHDMQRSLPTDGIMTNYQYINEPCEPHTRINWNLKGLKFCF